MHPEWTHKAQKQIDDIVGPDRLPSFADRPRLPYIEAVMRGQFVLLQIIVRGIYWPQKPYVGVQGRGLASPIDRLLMTLLNTTGSSTSSLQEPVFFL